MFSAEQFDIIRFCAEECERQESGEKSVEWMIRSYQIAMSWSNPPHFNYVDLMEVLGRNVEPYKNIFGFRTTPVSFPGGEINNLSYAEVYTRLERLVHFLPDMAPDEFYQAFEEIHPFRDGNGRVGAIMYNVLNKTLDNPVVPPRFKNKGEK